MANRDILAIGTSAGGFDALRFLAGEFPRDFSASVLVVIHLSSQFHSSLDAILTQSGPLPASFAADGAKFEKGHIYIAPPERHLLVESEQLRLGSGPRENNARPAIDPLFRSVGLCCGPRAIGAVLTGTLGDGAAGLLTLRQCGGVTVVQDPSDAVFSEMPTTALTRSQPDHVVGLAGMPALFEKLVRRSAGQPTPVPGGIDYEVNVAKGGPPNMRKMDHIGRRSVLACPDCQGVMWEIDEGDLIRYRCHVGHAYTAELMSVALDENPQASLWQRAAGARRAYRARQKIGGTGEQQRPCPACRKLGKQGARIEQEAAIIRDSIRRTDEIAARESRRARDRRSP